MVEVSLTFREVRLLLPILKSSYEMDHDNPEMAPTKFAAGDWDSMIEKVERGVKMSNEMSKTHDEIDEMFEKVLMEVDGPSVGFIESLYDQWEEKSFLTEKQIAALEKYYENCQGDS